jgi:hypothetical protein
LFIWSRSRGSIRQKRGKNKYKKKAIEKEQTEIEREGENI